MRLKDNSVNSVLLRLKDKVDEELQVKSTAVPTAFRKPSRPESLFTSVALTMHFALYKPAVFLHACLATAAELDIPNRLNHDTKRPPWRMFFATVFLASFLIFFVHQRTL